MTYLNKNPMFIDYQRGTMIDTNRTDLRYVKKSKKNKPM